MINSDNQLICALLLHCNETFSLIFYLLSWQTQREKLTITFKNYFLDDIKTNSSSKRWNVSNFVTRPENQCFRHHVNFNGKVCQYEMQPRFEMFNKDLRPIHLLFADQTFKLILSGLLLILQGRLSDNRPIETYIHFWKLFCGSTNLEKYLAHSLQNSKRNVHLIN